ncbi:hypothetical protein WHR41_01068 [Cladosporium halotolerans]|uniref:Uncharacterized protein n=1 Tax=Cladosporium halotolerans TaxID=1052096 RepID=A0AB34KZ43_9PEZI
MSEFDHAFKAALNGNHQPPLWADRDRPVPQDMPQVTQRAIDMYMCSQQPNGEMGGIGWWQTANGYTAMALHDLWSHRSTHNYPRLAQAVKNCESHRRGFINEFNDDTLWWGVLCLDLYALGGDGWFLEKAVGIWEYMRRRGCVIKKGQYQFREWDMEGALFWTTREGDWQVNSITTGLYVELSARLALIERQQPHHQGGGGGHGLHQKHPRLGKMMDAMGLGADGGHGGSFEEYLEAARCSLGWILRVMYKPKEGLVTDNILLKRGEKRDWTFSYLTGTTISACAGLYEVTGQMEYLKLAIHMAHKGLKNLGWVEEDGVLTECGQWRKGQNNPMENNDCIGFKSVFMRHMGTLYETITRLNPPDEAAHQEARWIKTFVNINYHSLQERNTNGNGQYGPWWKGPFECPTSHSQMAMLDAMAAVRLVNRP